MKISVEKLKWISGITFTLFIALIGIFSRIIDRTLDGSWTIFQKTLVSDGRYYLFQSERFRGRSIADSINSVLETFGPETFQLSNLKSESFQMVETRPLYPLLTSIFGTPNSFTMMIVPMLSWVFIHIFLFINLKKHFNYFAVIIVIVIVSTSFYFRYNLLSTSTDALALALILPYLHICLLGPRSNRDSLISLILAISSLLVRPVAPILILTSTVILLFNKARLERFFHSIVLFISIGHLTYLQIFEKQISIQAQANGSSFDLDFIIQAIFNVPKIVVIEFAFLATNDTFLFIFVIFGIVATFFLEMQSKVVMLAVFTACFLSGGINGTIGNGFRYQVSLLIICTYTTLALIKLKFNSSKSIN